MSDVPLEVERDILLRLPVGSLFRFRSVCKSWLCIIDDPSFVRSYTTNNHRFSPNLLTRSGTGTLHSFPLDSLKEVNGEQTIQATHVKNLTRPGVPRVGSLPVPSCNGLILISHNDTKRTWAICNPSTGDFHELPQPDVIPAYTMGVGFGYDSRSDDYKVVRIGRIHQQDEAAQTLIYSLKSKSWRTIMNFPLDFMYFKHMGSDSVYFKGAVHWISLRGTILALDMANEEYRELQATPRPEMWQCRVRLKVLDGFLVWSNELMVQAWMMRGYGTEEAIWVELFTAEERSVITGIGSKWSVWPLAYSHSERRLIMQRHNSIMLWDIEKRSVKSVSIDGLPGDYITSQVVPPSLYRFNGGGGSKRAAAGVKRKRSKRFKFTATTIDSLPLDD